MNRKKPYSPRPRFWDDHQLASWLGCCAATMRRRIEQLDDFPAKDPLFGWDIKAIEKYFDARGGLITSIPNAANDTDEWDCVIDGIDKAGLSKHL